MVYKTYCISKQNLLYWKERRRWKKNNNKQVYFYAKCFGLKKNNKNNWNKIKLWKSNSITIMFFGFLAVSKHATIDRSINNSLNACKATAAAHLPKLWETIYEICVLYKYLAKTRSPCRFIHIVSAMPAALSLLLLLKQIKQIRKWTRPKKNKEKIKKTCDIFANLARICIGP